MAYTLAPLPYDESALSPYISAQTLSFHYGKHHKGYVDNLNKLIPGTEYDNLPLEDLIKAVHGQPDKAGFFNNAAQIWNHDFYWNSLKPGGGGEPGGTLGELIKDSFGSYEEFKNSSSPPGPPSSAAVMRGWSRKTASCR